MSAAHIFRSEDKVYGGILFHVLWVCRFGQCYCAKLKNIADTQLCRRYAVFLCHLCNHRVLKCLAVGNGRIGLHLNVLPLCRNSAVMTVLLCEASLVHHGLYPAIG